MKAVIILMCLIGLTLSMPLSAYRQLQQQMLQQIYHQQQPQQTGTPRMLSLSQEALQEMALYRRLTQQQSAVFPQMHGPMGVQPQLPQTPIGQTPLQGPPQQGPPQGQMPSQSSPQELPMFKLVDFQPGFQQQQQTYQGQQYDYENPFLLHHVPAQQTPVVANAGGVPAMPQATAAPGQQGEQAGQQRQIVLAPQPGIQVLQPHPQGPQPGTQGQQPTLSSQLPPIFHTFGIVPIMPQQAQEGQQFPGYGMFFNAQCSPQPAPPALPGQPQQQEILYLQIQPAQTAMGGVGLGIVSSEELQAAGGMAGFGGYIPILGGAGYAGFAGGVAGTEGIIPGGPQTGVQTAGVIPIGQGGSPVVPDVLPSGQGTLTPTLRSTISVQGNQPAPQSRNPNTGTTPAGARSVTAQNPPAGSENPTQRPPVNNAATQRAVVKNKQVPEMDDYKASNLFP